MLEKIINSIGKKLRLVLGGTLLAGVTSFISPKSEASIVEDYTQTSEQPIITMLDYRGDVSSLDAVGSSALYEVQSFIALDNFIIDGSLKLKLASGRNYLQVFPDNNGIPDVENILGSTNEIDEYHYQELYDYYLREFGFFAVQVTPGERYWLGLYNPDITPHAVGEWSIYGNPNPYADGTSGHKPRIDRPWEIRSDGIDLGFSITFSNVDESSLLELLLAGFGLGGLFLRKKFKKKK